MKKITFLIAGILSICSSSVFACTNPTDRDYLALLAATGLEKATLVQKLSATYCYDLNTFDFRRMDVEHPIYYAPNVTFLNYYTKKSRDVTEYKNHEYNLDVLSKLLILPYTAHEELNLAGKQKVINILKNYDSSASLEWFNNDRQTIENPKARYSKPEVLANHKEMVNYLYPLYSKLFTFPEDTFGNNVLTYALITNEYDTFNALSKNSSNIYRRNKNGLTLLHLAFAKHAYSTDTAKSLENQKKINDILIKNFKPSYEAYLSLSDTSFYHFAEIMKENNMDLYEKLKAKTNFKINNVVLEKDRKNKDGFVAKLDFLRFLN